VVAADLLAAAVGLAPALAKFFEIDQTLTDLHIPWADILRTLRAGGYTGWLSSEYDPAAP
jgi:hypothetical protein